MGDIPEQCLRPRLNIRIGAHHCHFKCCSAWLSEPLLEINRLNQVVRILGVPVSVVTMDAAVATILDWVRTHRAQYVCVRDVHGVMRAQSDPDLLHLHETAGLVTPDGMPLVWICHWRGARAATRVCGPDLVANVCRASQAFETKHFFFGGKPGVADRMAKNLKRTYPRMSVVGTYSPAFGGTSPRQDDEVTSLIRESKAQIVWVGMSTPKQEFWMKNHVGKIPGATLIGVGAAFDLYAGTVSRAPQWMQRNGLEWLYRLCHEPRRLGRRYLVMAPKFVLLALREQLLLH